MELMGVGWGGEGCVGKKSGLQINLPAQPIKTPLSPPTILDAPFIQGFSTPHAPSLLALLPLPAPSSSPWLKSHPLAHLPWECLFTSTLTPVTSTPGAQQDGGNWVHFKGEKNKSQRLHIFAQSQ